jgi:hypothetical protein
MPSIKMLWFFTKNIKSMKYKDTNWNVHGKCDTHHDIIDEEEKEQYLIENGYCPCCENSTEEAIGNYYADTSLLPRLLRRRVGRISKKRDN